MSGISLSIKKIIYLILLLASFPILALANVVINPILDWLDK